MIGKRRMNKFHPPLFRDRKPHHPIKQLETYQADFVCIDAMLIDSACQTRDCTGGHPPTSLFANIVAESLSIAVQQNPAIQRQPSQQPEQKRLIWLKTIAQSLAAYRLVAGKRFINRTKRRRL